MGETIDRASGDCQHRLLRYFYSAGAVCVPRYRRFELATIPMGASRVPPLFGILRVRIIESVTSRA